MAVPLAEPLQLQPESRNFTVVSQSLEIEVDLLTQSIRGNTTLQLLPSSKSLRQIRLNCRQCKLGRIAVENEIATYSYRDPFERLKPQASYGVHQHNLYSSRFAPQLKDPPEEELVIRIPNKVHVKELNPFAATQTSDTFSKSTKGTGNASTGLDTPALATAVEQNAAFAPLSVTITFEVHSFREGLQFVGTSSRDARYPHVFTQTSPFVGAASCLFPCVDDLQSRCVWEMRIKTARTLGEALRRKSVKVDSNKLLEEHGHADGPAEPAAMDPDLDDNAYSTLSEAEQALDMQVICSGELMDEVVDPSDPSQKLTSFSCQAAVSPNQIGFAVGPFVTVELSDLREVDEDEKLGTEAVRVQAYCLPGRIDEVRNTAMPMAKAVDYFTTNFTTFPFPSFQMCFVDDLLTDTMTNAGFSFCSTRLLFPEDIIDPIYEVTRKLVHTLASQYSGISIAPKDLSDTWCIVGMAYFMTDLFLKQMCGNNEYRYQQKLAADKVFEQDFERPPLHNLGSILQLDPSEAEFLALKSSVVLFILDRRLTKGSGSTGMARIISRTITNAKAGDAEATLLSTGQLQRTCEKMGHVKLDSFFQQWVYGAGCPQFMISQRFNKKKLVVEMQIIQTQGDPDKNQRNRELNPDNFLRDVSEDTNEVYAGSVQNVFTGPMTIRIHEADGTPYEHIVEIKEANTRFEIPYNTKYKRLKRSRRQKERTTVTPIAEPAPEANDDVLLYCLGDVLQSEEEVVDWRLHDWPKEEEERMSQESYEWIRMDADFEWICKMHINMPAYMYISQLQQDRDVVAQLESLQWIALQREHWLISTFLTRTIMDRRYFHGIRTQATSILPKCAKEELSWIGLYHLHKIFQELYCAPKSPVTRPNDFSDRAAYLVQTAIPKAVSTIKDANGRAPITVKRFFLDQLKFNDNNLNPFSDCYYVATLLRCLTETLSCPTNQLSATQLESDELDEEESFRREAISEIERYRRIDEWVSSYKNIFSVTALHCILLLAKSKVLQPKLADFMHYTRTGNAEDLRLQAFRCLVDLDALEHGAVVKYILHTLSHDASPYVRAQVWLTFGRGLGRIAISGQEQDPNSQISDSLIIEQEVSMEARQEEFARKNTIEGAVAALRKGIGANTSLKQGLWAAVTSPFIGFTEMMKILDLCAILYDEDDSLLVTLKYPRYWICNYLGQGKVIFWKTDKIRTTKTPPRTGATAPKATPTTAAATKIKINKPTQPKLERKQSAVSNSGPASVRPSPLPPVNTPLVSATAAPLQDSTTKGDMGPPQSKKRQLIVKLKTGGRIPPYLFGEQSAIKTESPRSSAMPPGASVSSSSGYEANRPTSGGVPRIKLSTSVAGTGKSVSPLPANSPNSGPPEGPDPQISFGDPRSSVNSTRSSPSSVSKSSSGRNKKRKSSESATSTPRPDSQGANGLYLDVGTSNKERKTSTKATPTPQPEFVNGNGSPLDVAPNIKEIKSSKNKMATPRLNRESASASGLNGSNSGRKRKSSASADLSPQPSLDDHSLSSTAGQNEGLSAPPPYPENGAGEPPQKKVKLKLNFGKASVGGG